ncbi:TraR/DksA C4-type zinc finger protein [Pseudomonas sp. B21-009]|uniref:TraR/DksA C4-type zinc finger protein n=2 Tax=Pseudomonas TaxID=286 RepID=UPI00215F789C|nr:MULTISPECIES: TraR/DksA C4-type zinc finger protein [unclassified Pseudomonas]UVL54739.1 TraR/DksA C4-type zinc finger protein [Pseudomonas sp. B21-035]UVM65298.1 TraR/DksA C4-type zinc finger protein [Pseudomonas sp. B21-009]
MADEIDRANEQVEYHLQVALQSRPRQSLKPSAQFCVDCEDPIPLPRQRAVAGCETCISCQGLRERWG